MCLLSWISWGSEMDVYFPKEGTTQAPTLPKNIKLSEDKGKNVSSSADLNKKQKPYSLFPQLRLESWTFFYSFHIRVNLTSFCVGLLDL